MRLLTLNIYDKIGCIQPLGKWYSLPLDRCTISQNYHNLRLNLRKLEEICSFGTSRPFLHVPPQPSFISTVRCVFVHLVHVVRSFLSFISKYLKKKEGKECTRCTMYQVGNISPSRDLKNVSKSGVLKTAFGGCYAVEVIR